MKTNVERIEQYVRCLLESWALSEEGDERVVWLTLHDLLMAVSRFELMSDAEKDMTTKLCKKLQYHFETKFNLKDRKRKTKKENFPPNPLIKEKEIKEKEQKHTHTVCDAKSDFRKLCFSYAQQYDSQRLADFYNYWSEEDESGRMLWQTKRFWNIENRLKRWMNNANTASDTAAAIRLKKVQKQQTKEAAAVSDLQQQAQQRQQADNQLEREIAERKAGAVSYEEWQAMKKKEAAE